MQPNLKTIKRLFLGGVATIALLTGGLFAIPARTPPIVDATGNMIPGSIAAIEKVRLGDADQWIVLRGKSTRAPILLFLAGGPGGSELGWVRKYNADLENHFVVVHWEQRGAGKSYAAIRDRDRMTPAQFVEDAHQLTLLLRQRFQQDKIYVIGHSGGTIWGIMLVQKYPHLFHAFIGTGQMVNAVENDQLGYQYVLREATQRNDTKLVEKLTRNGPPPYRGDRILWRYLDYLMPLAGYEHEKMAANGGHGGNSIEEMVNIPEFTWMDRINAFRGLIDTFGIVYPQLETLNFEQQAATLEVPVYFLIGRHDLNTMASLTTRYYNHLQAPQKHLIWFEQSGHNPCYQEPEKFNQVLIEQILPETLPKTTEASPVVVGNAAPQS